MGIAFKERMKRTIEVIMHADKLKNVLSLNAQDRYGYFIRKVADAEILWLINEDGRYVTLGDGEGFIIPVWPEREFAELMLVDGWKHCAVERLDVADFIGWLNELEEEGYRIAGFPSELLNAIVVNAAEMKAHLLHELHQYE